MSLLRVWWLCSSILDLWLYSSIDSENYDYFENIGTPKNWNRLGENIKTLRLYVCAMWNDEMRWDMGILCWDGMR